MADPNIFTSPSSPGVHGSQHLLGGDDPIGMGLLFPPAVTLTDAANILTDAALGMHFRVTLEGDRELANPTNLSDTQRLTWEIIQDGTGGRQLTFGSKFTFGTDLPSPTLSTVAGQRDFITAIYNGTTDKLYVVGFARGF